MIAHEESAMPVSEWLWRVTSSHDEVRA
jgi:hypothetical protein